LYKGVGIPGSKVFISLLPNTYDLQTVTDKDGIWKASSNTPLNPGTYTMKVNTTDEQNKPVSLNRTFTIEKSGEAVLGEATGSATLTPTKTIAPKITSSPQATPTTAVVATETPQPTYPVTTSVTITPAPTLPETGINYMAFSMLSVALIIIGAGMILIF
ncbi:MAG TPA: hypothetical protein VK338_01145, partial [Candidatus Nitrosocosmicus sp.]|nr:hypothetical protein [Candidatus Nitrosocosmicus sp.]